MVPSGASSSGRRHRRRDGQALEPPSARRACGARGNGATIPTLTTPTSEEASLLIEARLRELLEPFRPVLRPVVRLVRRLTGWPSVRTRPVGPVVAVGPHPDGIGPDHPIRALRRSEFSAMERAVPYYRGRWTYMSVATAIADELIERHGLRSALELGPHLRSIVVGADVMDLRSQPDLEAEGRLIVHDARRTPWPIDDGAYDVFVALQVFEHLGAAQADAFREVRRIARHAIISLPIDWVMDDPGNCHHGISHERALAWFAPIAPTRVELGNGGPRKRLVYVFEGLVPPGDGARPSMAVAAGEAPDRSLAASA